MKVDRNSISLFSLLVLGYGYYLRQLSFTNSCEMTYMRPGYEDIEVPWNDNNEFTIADA